MRLEDLTVTLRPRGAWEAVDLGCALVRRDYGRVLALWAATVLPVWIALAVLMRDLPAWYALVVWWLKPLYDRVPLHFLSRAAFGVRPGFKETWKEWPRLWSRFLFSALVLRRLSLIRSFALPVMMLEGQRGRDGHERVRALATEGGASGVNVTWVFLKLEAVVFLGLIALTISLAPDAGLPDIEEIFVTGEINYQVPAGIYWWLNALYLAAVTLVEPFYVGAGFGLYLNCRTKLEGWDIELTFRKLAARLRQTAVALVVLACLCMGSTAFAQEKKPAPKTAAEAPAKVEDEGPKEAARRILARPEFEVQKRKVKRWIQEINEGPKFGGVPEFLRISLYVIGWGLLATLVVWLVLYLMRNRHLFADALGMQLPVKQARAPRVVMGMDIARESLPADILAAARAAWLGQRPREALSLLYRGALSSLVEQQRLPIRDSDTEDDCLLHAARSSAARPMVDYFRQLTLLWMRAAYAGIEVAEPEFEHLCRGWPFAPSAPQPRQAGQVFVRTSVLLALLTMTGCNGRWVEEDRETGYKGKARTHPFLAAEMLLHENGHGAERLPLLKDMPDPHKGMLLISGEGGMPAGRARQLLTWTERGGHLVYALAGCAPYNDWGFLGVFGGTGFFGNQDRQDPILEQLGIKATDRRIEWRKTEEERAKATGKKPNAEKTDEADEQKTPHDAPTEFVLYEGATGIHTLEIPNYITFELGRKLRRDEYRAGTQQKSAVLSLRHGQGRITVISHARPLRNRYLAGHDHAAWLLELVGEKWRNVQFIVSLEGSFWALLWQRAWMPIIGLACIILFWLWLNMPRFGPVRAVELHETRHFTDHIAALGQFFHRLRRDDVLLRAAQDAVRVRALRRHPHLRDGGDAALVPVLSESSGLPSEQIRAALAQPLPGQPYQMVRLLHLLQTLRQSL